MDLWELMTHICVIGWWLRQPSLYQGCHFLVPVALILYKTTHLKQPPVCSGQKNAVPVATAINRFQCTFFTYTGSSSGSLWVWVPPGKPGMERSTACTGSPTACTLRSTPGAPTVSCYHHFHYSKRLGERWLGAKLYVETNLVFFEASFSVQTLKHNYNTITSDCLLTWCNRDSHFLSLLCANLLGDL